jgi:hypothetical protein
MKLNLPFLCFCNQSSFELNCSLLFALVPVDLIILIVGNIYKLCTKIKHSYVGKRHVMTEQLHGVCLCFCCPF